MGEIIFKDESYAIIGACFEVYREMGCGFLEAVYQECLALELQRRGIPFVQQRPLALAYKDQRLETSYQPDFLCYEKIILELKAAKELGDEHRAQVHNYLKASGLRLGLLVNFGHYPKLEYERIVRLATGAATKYTNNTKGMRKRRDHNGTNKWPFGRNPLPCRLLVLPVKPGDARHKAPTPPFSSLRDLDAGLQFPARGHSYFPPFVSFVYFVVPLFSERMSSEPSVVWHAVPRRRYVSRSAHVLSPWVGMFRVASTLLHPKLHADRPQSRHDGMPHTERPESYGTTLENRCVG